MRPVTFGGCAGWLHEPEPRRRVRFAVLICPALSRDALNAHQGLRVLADRLAGAGYPALRFDYPGTGDSADAPEAGNCWEDWRASVEGAADWLRSQTGAEALIFCGLRIGALLAACAAQARPDVAGLLLLAPVWRGRNWARQLWVEARLQGAPLGALEAGFGFQEFRFSAAAVAALAAVRLLEWPLPPGLAVAVAGPDAPARMADGAAAWGGGALLPWAGLAPLLAHNLHASGPGPDFSAVLAWVTARLPQAPLSGALPDLKAGGLRAADWAERAVRFGTGLWGVACEPARGPGDAALIIVNSGRDPRQGVARFGVELARRLAAEGMASLRFDFAGLGDSPGPAGAEDALSPVFDLPRGADIAAAVAWLDGCGYRRIFAYGLCAGAYHVLRAAVDGARLDGVALLNLPLFVWRAGDSVDVAKHRNLPAGHYARQLLRAEFWRRSLSKGRSLRHALAAHAGFLWGAGHVRRDAQSQAAHDAMRALARRGVGCLMLYAPDDIGAGLARRAFGPGGLARYSGMEMIILESFDHMLTMPAMRAEAARRIGNFMRAGAAALAAD